MQIYLNSIGVLMTTAGAYLVWRYLTELSFVDKQAYLRGEGSLVVPDPSPEEVRAFRLSLALSKLGLCLIVIGGAAQILSNHLAQLFG